MTMDEIKEQIAQICCEHCPPSKPCPGAQNFDCEWQIDIVNSILSTPIGKTCPECGGTGMIEKPDYSGEVYPADCQTCVGTGTVSITIEQAIEECLKGEGK